MDELGPDEQKWLDVLRSADEPSTDDRARVRAAVIAGIAGATATTAAGLAKAGSVAKTAGTATLFASSWKIGVGILALAIAGGIASVAVTRAAAPIAGNAMPTAATPALTASPEPSAPPSAIAPASAPAETPPPTENVGPTKATSATRAPVRAAASRPPPLHDDVDAELVLLTQAQHYLERGDADGALSALARHAREHPRGALALERDGLRAIAACEAKRSDGRVLAERFVAAHPTSPLLARIRTACLSP